MKWRIGGGRKEGEKERGGLVEGEEEGEDETGGEAWASLSG